MARLIGSHEFAGSCPRNRPFSSDRGSVCTDCGQWHGGARCVRVLKNGKECGFPKFEHAYDYTGAQRSMDSQSGSGMLSEIREQISQHFPMRHSSKISRAILQTCFTILHAGDYTEKGSLQPTMTRKLHNRLGF